MELATDIPNNLLHRPATDFALFYLAAASVNDVMPLRLGVSVHGIIEAGNELPGQIRPIFFRQSQDFGHSLSSKAHTGAISARRLALTRPMISAILLAKEALRRLRCPAAL
jgi:hypothetical protein